MPNDNVVYPQLEKEVTKFSRKLEALRRKAATQKTESQSIESEISALEDGLKAFQESCRGNLTELTQSFELLQAEYLKIFNRLKILTSPPFGFMTFVRFIRMEKFDEDAPEVPLIEVKDSRGTIARVYFMDEKTNVHHLKYGQYLIHAGREPNHVLETLDEFKTEGVAGSVLEVLAPDHNGMRVLVTTTENGTPQVMHAALCVGADTLKKGSRVLADTAVGLVLEVLAQKETSETYLVAQVPDVTFDDIGGLEAIKEEIETWLIHPILFPKTSKRMGEPRPKGCVLQGGPGLGKTMLAKAIVNRLHILRCAQLGLDPTVVTPLFYSVNGPELLSKWVGEAERGIRELFAEARRHSKEGIPVGIFIDEAESLLGIRGSGISSDVEKTIVPMFTSEMQGLEETGSENVFVILASNLAHNIDAAVKRPGRCDQIITVPRPDRLGAVKIFEKYLAPDWLQLHPKYNKDVYPPTDRHGKPRVDDSGKPIHLQFGCDAARVQKYLIERTVARIFDETSRNVVVEITYDGGKKQVVHYNDLVSGALIASIVKRAKRFARRRFTYSLEQKGLLVQADEFSERPAEELTKMGIEPLGVQLQDLLEAVEKVYAEIDVPNDSRSMRHWLLIENLAEGRDVESLSFTKNPVSDED